ncbi:molecular chaperone [Providencia huaxiensis]
MTTGPLIATPLVQRLEPNIKSMIEQISTTDVSKLPKDRESIYYFNLREIPPKSDKPNVMQVALQSRIKLFYRPEPILDKAKTDWALNLELNTVNDGYIKNTSPFYLTVIGLAGDKNKSENGAFDSFMIDPFGSHQVKSTHFQKPYLTYINDYGGRPTVSFNCKSSVCKADSQQ